MNIIRGYRIFKQCLIIRFLDLLDVLWMVMLNSFTVILKISINVLLFKVLFSYSKYIAGWRLEEMFIFLGTFFLINCLAGAMYNRGFSRIPFMIENGELDLLLTKPLYIPRFLSFRHLDPIFLWPQFFLSITLIIYGFLQVGSTYHLGFYFLFLIGAFILHYSFSLLFVSLNFWVIIPNILQIFNTINNDLGKYPITIFSGAIKWFLSFIFPIAFMYTVPASVLLGKIDLSKAGLFLIIVIIFYFSSKILWQIGLKKYESGQG